MEGAKGQPQHYRGKGLTFWGKGYRLVPTQEEPQNVTRGTRDRRQAETTGKVREMRRTDEEGARRPRTRPRSCRELESVAAGGEDALREGHRPRGISRERKALEL